VDVRSTDELWRYGAGGGGAAVVFLLGADAVQVDRCTEPARDSDGNDPDDR